MTGLTHALPNRATTYRGAVHEAFSAPGTSINVCTDNGVGMTKWLPMTGLLVSYQTLFGSHRTAPARTRIGTGMPDASDGDTGESGTEAVDVNRGLIDTLLAGPDFLVPDIEVGGLIPP